MKPAAQVAVAAQVDQLRVVAGGRLMPPGAREWVATTGELLALLGSFGLTEGRPMSQSLVGRSAQIGQGASSGSCGLGQGALGVEGGVPSNSAVKQTALAGGILVKTKRVAVGAAAYGERWAYEARMTTVWAK